MARKNGPVEESRALVSSLSRRELCLFFIFCWFVQVFGSPFTSPAVVPKYQAEEYKNRTTREIDCGEEEYPLEVGQCCVKCSAGTYVEEHCRITHEQGKCGNCVSGEEFTEHNNGLEKCLSCKRCRSDQEVVSICTPTKDTVCQCKPKTFCPPDQPCEQCYRCMDKCLPGKKLIQNCSATSDIVCEDPVEPQEPVSTVLVVILSLAAVIVAVVIICLKIQHTKHLLANTGSLQDSTKTRASDSSLATPLLMSENPLNATTVKQLDELCLPFPGSFASEQKLQTIESSQENNLNTSPSGDSLGITNSSQEYGGEQMVNENHNMIPASCPAPAEPPDKPMANLSDGKDRSTVQIYPVDAAYYTFIQEVPNKEWKKFMRHMQLTENEIDAAVQDNPCGEEQKYQMLCKWKLKCGKEANVKKLLQGLEEINLRGCAENVYNNLVAKDTAAH